jgi:hypothetical protein
LFAAKRDPFNTFIGSVSCDNTELGIQRHFGAPWQNIELNISGIPCQHCYTAMLKTLAGLAKTAVMLHRRKNMLSGTIYSYINFVLKTSFFNKVRVRNLNVISMAMVTKIFTHFFRQAIPQYIILI